MLTKPFDHAGVARRIDPARGELPTNRGFPVSACPFRDVLDSGDESPPAASPLGQHTPSVSGQTVIAAPSLALFSTQCPTIQPRRSRR